MFLAASVAALTGSSAQADSVRSAEWPLDSHHFQADKVWQLSRGGGITVAVVDSGVAASHPDLAGQVLPGTSLLGDGGDGRTDTSGDSHGTSIAGIIAATGGPAPGTGLTGLAPDAKILPVRVAQGSQVSPSTLAQGIVWAADHGARVINISIGSPSPDPLLRQAVTYALRKDIVLVASAGNQGESDNPALYPAAFPGVVSVSGIDQNGQFWKPSESGTGITLAAPAEEIYSANDQGQYVNASGTSYAAAYVSASAALVRARYPQLTNGQVIRRLITTTDGHHNQPDPKTGYGRLNPLAALTARVDTADTGNPLLHPAPNPPVPTGHSPSLALALAALGVTGLAAMAVVLMWRRKRRTTGNTPTPEDRPLNKIKHPHRPSARPSAAARQGGSRPRNQPNRRHR
ncbi:type VII secretion-associated serine protease mycosin [Kitasatospora sp. NPDC049285]|uniref:type VII secretion-associated serine protease mycosin n=1 Tax=Kitasatospora sp. NPDC049285 TaxID=3157096 RepID=UPI0034341F6E